VDVTVPSLDQSEVVVLKSGNGAGKRQERVMYRYTGLSYVKWPLQFLRDTTGFWSHSYPSSPHAPLDTSVSNRHAWFSSVAVGEGNIIPSIAGSGIISNRTHLCHRKDRSPASPSHARGNSLLRGAHKRPPDTTDGMNTRPARTTPLQLRNWRYEERA
jgi:hypothetical protein